VGSLWPLCLKNSINSLGFFATSYNFFRKNIQKPITMLFLRLLKSNNIVVCEIFFAYLIFQTYNMEKTNFQFEYEAYENIEKLPEQDKKLIEKAIETAKKAYAPYSSFNVGAAVLLENNQIVSGNNQENAAYPSGLCAERVALFYANANYPEESVKSIAIVALKDGELIDHVVTPCGNCRQAMLETEIRFRKPIRIVMGGKNGFWVVSKAQYLLPLSFTGDSL
jgi:cytidine deaminase